MNLTTQIALMLATLLAPFATQAEFKQPWDAGEDMGDFYQQWCTTEDLESAFFPAFSAEDRGRVRSLMLEVTWIDFSCSVPSTLKLRRWLIGSVLVMGRLTPS
ncbi:TPA: hypothetical protein SH370_005957 [Pseudomonas aeruginosa]|nr:hypothetical protein DY955_25535 [Pseudomonas aeruginosa]HEH8639386.1 hypothetical protein [Pseudomonas aeruginosa]